MQPPMRGEGEANSMPMRKAMAARMATVKRCFHERCGLKKSTMSQIASSPLHDWKTIEYSGHTM